MEHFYSSIEEARREIANRWKDKDLERKVSEYLAGDIPDCMRDEPHAVLFKNIMTPNDENRRALSISKELGIPILGLEFKEDKFVAFNLDKYIFGMLFFYMEKRHDGRIQVHKKKVMDIDKAQGKIFSSLNTLWGEPLIEFHHNMLYRCFPEYQGRIQDISEWIARNGKRSREYYEKMMGLFIRNCILIENVQFPGQIVPHASGVKDESDFTKTVVLPAFKKAEEYFGIKPLIVQLAPADYLTDPTWWHYRTEIRPIVEAYISEKRASSTAKPAAAAAQPKTMA